jgi:hypothetical protein
VNEDIFSFKILFLLDEAKLRGLGNQSFNAFSSKLNIQGVYKGRVERTIR